MQKGIKVGLKSCHLVTSVPSFFKHTTSLSPSIPLTCPCPSASICPSSYFGKHNLYWLSVILDSSLMVCVCVCVCAHFGKETSLAVKSWNIRWTIGLCDVCLPGLSASACFDMCVWGLARFAGHDARLSWWICILAKRTDKGRDGGGRGVGWGAWVEG